MCKQLSVVRPLHCHWLLLKVHRSTQGHKDTIWPEGGSYIKDKIIKLLISFTPSAASYPLGGIINPPAPPESSGWHKKNSQAFKSSPLCPLSLLLSPMSCSSLRSTGFHCDGLSCEGPEWLWQARIAAVPRCLGGLGLLFQDDSGKPPGPLTWLL